MSNLGSVNINRTIIQWKNVFCFHFIWVWPISFSEDICWIILFLFIRFNEKIHTLSSVHFDRLFFSSSCRNLVVLFMKKECFDNSLLQNSQSFDKTVSGIISLEQTPFAQKVEVSVARDLSLATHTVFYKQRTPTTL